MKSKHDLLFDLIGNDGRLLDAKEVCAKRLLSRIKEINQELVGDSKLWDKELISDIFFICGNNMGMLFNVDIPMMENPLRAVPDAFAKTFADKLGNLINEEMELDRSDSIRNKVILFAGSVIKNGSRELKKHILSLDVVSDVLRSSPTITLNKLGYLLTYYEAVRCLKEDAKFPVNDYDLWQFCNIDISSEQHCIDEFSHLLKLGLDINQTGDLLIKLNGLNNVGLSAAKILNEKKVLNFKSDTAIKALAGKEIKADFFRWFQSVVKGRMNDLYENSEGVKSGNPIWWSFHALNKLTANYKIYDFFKENSSGENLFEYMARAGSSSSSPSCSSALKILLAEKGVTAGKIRDFVTRQDENGMCWMHKVFLRDSAAEADEKWRWFGDLIIRAKEVQSRSENGDGQVGWNENKVIADALISSIFECIGIKDNLGATPLDYFLVVFNNAQQNRPDYHFTHTLHPYKIEFFNKKMIPFISFNSEPLSMLSQHIMGNDNKAVVDVYDSLVEVLDLISKKAKFNNMGDFRDQLDLAKLKYDIFNPMVANKMNEDATKKRKIKI